MSEHHCGCGCHEPHHALSPQLDADNRRAFAAYQQRPDVRAVRPEALEKRPASIAALRQTIQ